jgi:spore maturation protein B
MYLSDLIIPILFGTIICYGLLKKISVFDVFIEGAVDGFKVVYKILPTLIGLMVAVEVLRSSGFLGFIVTILSPVFSKIGLPSSIIPIIIMRTVSSSASTGLVLELFKTYGPDSLEGRMTSIMMGCTETIFYTMSIYFLSVKVKKTRYTLQGALIVTLSGIIASVMLTYFIFY